MEALIAATSRD